MPNRILREGILTSERVNRLSVGAEVFFRRLMSVADDLGRFPAHVGLLQSNLYPLQLDKASESDVSRWLAETIENELVICLEESGRSYLEILNFFQRGTISAKDRRKVLAAGACVRCGSSDRLSVDHVKPVRLGGRSESGNYQCLCRSCNSSKRARVE